MTEDAAGEVDCTLGVGVLSDSLFGVVVSRSEEERGEGERLFDVDRASLILDNVLLVSSS